MVAINFPDSPTNGQEHSGYVWDATNNVWNRLPTLPALDLVNFSAVAPSNPQDGQFWFDTTAGKMYVYYNDGSSAQWVSTLGGLVGQTGTEGQILVHNGTEWLPSDGISHNAIINGDFGIWQRGTSLSTTANDQYLADRWFIRQGTTPTNRVITRETFTPGDIEAIGYGDAEYFNRVTITGTTNYLRFQQRVEDVRTLADQQVTVSFWVRSDVSTVGQAYFFQKFGSGGSGDVTVNLPFFDISSSWQRVVLTVTVPSTSGKTIGTSSSLQLLIQANDVSDGFVDIWGVQLEAGSVATPFRLAGGGSKGAELALCQRYYYLHTQGSSKAIALGTMYSTTVLLGTIQFPVAMRIVPSAEITDATNAYRLVGDNAATNFDSFYVDRLTNQVGRLVSTSITSVQGRTGVIETNSGSTAVVAFRAEL